MVAWLKALLFVAGGVTAAAGAAYVTGMLDPWLTRPPAVVAALPESPTRPAPQGETPAASEDVPQPDDPATTGKQSRLVAPSFDLVRVEPDGSVLVAGKAPAEARVELLSKDEVLAGTDADSAGDFVIVLDEPLPGGDYVFSLRATREDEEPALSTETAVVSIPETESGEVLVMVDEPGAPSQLLTVPDAPQAAGEASEADDADSGEQLAAGEPVGQETAPGSGEQQTSQPDGDAPAEEEVAAPAQQPAPAGANDGDELASAQPDNAASGEDAAAGLPAAGGQELASAPQDADAGTETEASRGVVVEAVEIEGDRIFVAGQAEPGLTVRVYADEVLLGDAVVSQAGRFLVEAQRELAVGNYLIRADLLGRDGSVLARAAVPFEREPGESIAAVAVQPDVETDAGEQQTAGSAPVEDAAEGEAAPEADPASGPAGEEQLAAASQPEAGEPDAAPAQQTDTPQQADGQDVATAPAAESTPQQAGEGESSTETGVASAPQSAADADQDATAPKLQRVDGSVIIRRGDTLWRISRRVYGQGIRYSTIYLANQNQIRDPDLIWPGQVFSVPQQTAEGEEADMDAIAGQVVSPDQDAATNR